MKKRYIFCIVFILLTILGTGLFTHFANTLLDSNFSFIKEYIISLGVWAPFVLFLFTIIASSIGFIFSIPVTISALLLPPFVAFIISALGLSFGAAISFFIFRLFARDFVHKRYIEKNESLKRYNEKIRQKGFWMVVLLRLIPFTPFELINIAGGLSKINFFEFLLATFIGIIPGTLLNIYFIHSTKNIFSIDFLISYALFSLFSVVPLLFKKVRHLIFKS